MADFPTGYMDNALDELAAVIEQAEDALHGVDFDTLVGTGFSGAVVIPALALRMGKKFVLIRKDDDDSHHGGGLLVGNIGERWIFLDDFVSMGRTRTRVLDKIRTAQRYDYLRGFTGPIETTYVGDYLYRGPGFRPAPTKCCGENPEWCECG